MTAWDPDDLPLTIMASRLPAGARFDSASGEFEWETTDVAEGSYTVPITATNSARRSATKTVAIEVRSEKPVLQKLINTASRANEGACSSGSRVTLVGSGFSQAPEDTITLLLNGESVDIVGSSATEIDFVCPEFTAGTAIALQVRRGSSSSEVLRAVAAETNPAIFSLDGSGTGQAMALHRENAIVVMQRSPETLSQPAVRTDTIRLIVNGLASVTGDISDQVSILIGGAGVKAKSVEKMDGGLWSISFEIPEAAPLGDAIPVTLEFTLPYGKPVVSNVTTIAIEPRSETDR